MPSAKCVLRIVRLKLPEPRPSIEDVMDKLMRDSKRGLVMEQADEVSEVLLTEIGAPLESKTMLHAVRACLLYTSPSPRDKRQSRMPSSA